MEFNTPLNGAEIGKELGISRQAVSYSIRKSIRKMYDYVLKMEYADTPFEAVLVLMNVLGINNGDTDDVISFIGLFDKEVRKSLTTDAIDIYGLKEADIQKKNMH